MLGKMCNSYARSWFSLFLSYLFLLPPPLCLFLCQTIRICSSFLMSLHFLSTVMRRNPFGVDICCRKGSRSPLQELYNPTQVSPGNFLAFLAWSPCINILGEERMKNSNIWFLGDLKLPLPDILLSVVTFLFLSS